MDAARRRARGQRPPTRPVRLRDPAGGLPGRLRRGPGARDRRRVRATGPRDHLRRLRLGRRRASEPVALPFTGPGTALRSSSGAPTRSETAGDAARRPSATPDRVGTYPRGPPRRRAARQEVPMRQQLLEAPVLVGEIALAPTTELAGLAELAGLTSLDDRDRFAGSHRRRPSATRTRSATTSPAQRAHRRAGTAPPSPLTSGRPAGGLRPSPSRTATPPTMTRRRNDPWAETKVGNRGSTRVTRSTCAPSKRCTACWRRATSPPPTTCSIARAAPSAFEPMALPRAREHLEAASSAPLPRRR